MRYFRLFIVTAFALFLTACASTRTATHLPSATAVETQWQHHQAVIEPIVRWKLNGRAALTSGNEGGTATVVWDQFADGYELEFYGILGQGRTRLTSTTEETRLFTAEGKQWVSPDAQSLLGEYTGWYLPVDNLFYWIRGLPSTNISIQNLALNAQGHLSHLQQAGWTITYEEYMLANGLWLPKRINLKHPGNAQHPALTIKWISKSWAF
jgi:outer membrane lipoprotein LolB